MRKIIIPLAMILTLACNLSQAAPNLSPGNQAQVVPHEARWGIYHLDLSTQHVELLYSSPDEIAGLRLNRAGDRLVFAMRAVGASSDNGGGFAQGGNAGAWLLRKGKGLADLRPPGERAETPGDTREEIFTIGAQGQDLRRVTNNELWDLYPAWSPDGSQIAFLSQRSDSLGIYVMQADGSQVKLLYDSSSHEADIDWVGEQIAFTKDSRIWLMQSDGSRVRQVSQPPKAGVWGRVNLPFGDYDPRISPDGASLAFERLVDDRSPHGNYDFFKLDLANANETRLTHTGYAQGLASWSSDGERILFVVAAIEETGKYDLYMMNADGSDNHEVTPGYFPDQFLCHGAVFGKDNSSIYFVGEWWE